MTNTQVATKKDIQELGTETKKSIQELRTETKELRTEMKSVRSAILRVEEKVENLQDEVKEFKAETRENYHQLNTKLDRLQNTLDGFAGAVQDLRTENTIRTHHTRELRLQVADHEIDYNELSLQNRLLRNFPIHAESHLKKAYSCAILFLTCQRFQQAVKVL